MLPELTKAPLQDHLKKAKAVHQQDVAKSCCRTLSTANIPMRRKTGAGNGSFPKNTGGSIPKLTNAVVHHMDESLVQKAVRDAVTVAGLTKRATCYTFRHSFATHLLERQ